MMLDGPNGLQIFVSWLLLVDHFHNVLRGKLQDHVKDGRMQLFQIFVVAPLNVDEGEVKVCGDELCELPEEAYFIVDFILVKRFQQCLSFVRQEGGELLSHIDIFSCFQITHQLQCICEPFFCLFDLCKSKREFLFLDRQHNLSVFQLIKLLDDQVAVVINIFAASVIFSKHRQCFCYLFFAEEKCIDQLISMLLTNSIKNVHQPCLGLFLGYTAQTHLEGLGPNITPFQALAQVCPPRVVEQFMRRSPLVDSLLKAQVHEVLACFTDLHFWIEFVLLSCYFIYQSRHTTYSAFSWQKGIHVVEKVISNDSQRPNIAFLVIYIPLDYFRGHCCWRPTVSLHPSVLEILRKAEIGQLDLKIVIDQEVGQLQVSVSYLFLDDFFFIFVDLHDNLFLRMDLYERLKDSSHQSFAVVLRNLSSFVFVLLKVSFSAVLQDDVPNAFISKIIDPLNNILMVKAFHQLHLFFCHCRVCLLHGLHLFYRNGLLGGHVLSLVHLCICSFSNLRKQLVLSTCFFVINEHLCKYLLQFDVRMQITSKAIKSSIRNNLNFLFLPYHKKKYAGIFTDLAMFLNTFFIILKYLYLLSVETLLMSYPWKRLLQLQDVRSEQKCICIFLRYNSSITPMLASDCLMEVMEAMPILGATMIRKTLFDIIINDCLYPDTSSVLTETAIFFRLKKNQGDVHVKINFSFQLMFQIIMKEQNNFDQKILHSIRLERGENFMVFTSQKNSKELEVWREFFEKGLNQKGFHQLFKAVKKIGKGSFATVYLVKKIEDEKYYAVKSFSKELMYAEMKGKEALINEIEVMRKLNHKHLVKIFGVYETDHSIYIVIQLVDGGLLSDRMLKKHRFSLLEIKMIMKSILEGLETMHKKYIMHRDIKPENILIRNEKTCQCVIGDFGLSQYVHADDYIFARCGTPGFVAPQIVNLRDKYTKYTQSCDLFSLGIIFHMLLLKKSPFSGRQYNQILIQNRACAFNYDSFQYKQLPEESINLLQRLLQKDPNKRITASQALKHSFFYSQFTIWESNKKYCHKNIDNPHRRIEAPLTMIRSNERKKITHIRGDSCLKFKMAQNVVIDDSKEIEEKKDFAIKAPQMKSSLKKTTIMKERKQKKVTIYK